MNFLKVLRILRETYSLIHCRHFNPFAALGAHVLDLSNGLWNRSSKDAAAVFGDEQVVLDADATEVLVGFQLPGFRKDGPERSGPASASAKRPPKRRPREHVEVRRF